VHFINVADATVLGTVVQPGHIEDGDKHERDLNSFGKELFANFQGVNQGRRDIANNDVWAIKDSGTKELFAVVYHVYNLKLALEYGHKNRPHDIVVFGYDHTQCF